MGTIVTWCEGNLHRRPMWSFASTREIRQGKYPGVKFTAPCTEERNNVSTCAWQGGLELSSGPSNNAWLLAEMNSHQNRLLCQWAYCSHLYPKVVFMDVKFRIGWPSISTSILEQTCRRGRGSSGSLVQVRNNTQSHSAPHSEALS